LGYFRMDPPRFVCTAGMKKGQSMVSPDLGSNPSVPLWEAPPVFTWKPGRLLLGIAALVVLPAPLSYEVVWAARALRPDWTTARGQPRRAGRVGGGVAGYPGLARMLPLADTPPPVR
jgi:hypothetical protein